MFPITMTIHTAAQLNAVMAALGTAGTQVAEAPAPVAAKTNDAALTTTAKTEKEAAARPGKSAQSATSPAHSSPTATEEAGGAAAQSTEQPATATAKDAAASSAAEPVTYERVGKAITDWVKKDRQKVVDTLTKHGVKKGPELKPEQYAAFLADLGA